MALSWGTAGPARNHLRGLGGGQGVLTETSKPTFSICQSKTSGTQVGSTCREEEGTAARAPAQEPQTQRALVGSLGRTETPANLGSRFWPNLP